MKKKASKKQKTESASAQNRCIWMTAGVISFKLCPLNFDCEQCDFDQVMRSQVRTKGGEFRVKKHQLKTQKPSEGLTLADTPSSESPLFFTFSAGEVNQELYLHPTHLWIRRTDDQKWMLGIDKLLAYVLPPPVEIELHGSSTVVRQNQPFGKIHTSAGIIPLNSPFSGTILQTNFRVAQCPELVQQNPQDEGWLTKMRCSPDRFESEKSYAGLAGKRFLEEEAQHLKFLLKHRGIEVDHIGNTLPDGGVHVKYLHQVLPEQVCLRLAVELMTSGKQAW